MEPGELEAKLRDIERHAELAASEYPRETAIARLRLIRGLARYARTQLADVRFDPERTTPSRP